MGEGEGALFFLPWGGEGGGEGSGGGGGRHLFLKLREVWEESFSVLSFFSLVGLFVGGGFRGGLGEVMEGGLGFVREGGEEGEGWVDGWKGSWEGGEFENRGGGGNLGGGVGEGIGIFLVLFLFLFLDLTVPLFGLGWKSGSSGSESFSREESQIMFLQCLHLLFSLFSPFCFCLSFSIFSLISLCLPLSEKAMIFSQQESHFIFFLFPFSLFSPFI